MLQKPVELILMRQLASSLAMPIFLVDAGGALAFYNEPAEALLGKRFDETGEMSVGEWASVWQPVGKDGTPLPAEEDEQHVYLTAGTLDEPLGVGVKGHLFYGSRADWSADAPPRPLLRRALGRPDLRAGSGRRAADAVIARAAPAAHDGAWRR